MVMFGGDVRSKIQKQNDSQLLDVQSSLDHLTISLLFRLWEKLLDSFSYIGLYTFASPISAKPMWTAMVIYWCAEYIEKHSGT